MAVNIGINIQRSPNRINQELRDAAVLGKFPKLFLDFKDQYYLASGGSKTLANAVTHARSGNAVMTDGYGPELVTNGDFTTDSDWTKGTGWSIRDGKAHCDGSQTGSTLLAQSWDAKLGDVYVFNFRVVSRDAGGVSAAVQGATPEAGYVTSTGYYEQVIRITAATASFSIRASNTFIGSIDNVSVRKMPVLKWAPHNLTPRSQEFDDAGWTKTATTITANAATAPDGTTTADEITHTTTSGAVNAAPTTVSGVKHRHGIFVKNVDASFLRIYHTSSESIFIDLSDGSIGTDTTASSSVTALDNDWFFVETEFTTDGAFLRSYFSLRASDGGSVETGTSAYLWGAHAYRSDLGGMVDNPDQPASRASYVPTTSSAKYLPRIGHHVYNGSAWVNEGLLAESESRTNILPKSGEFSTWSTRIQVTVADDAEISPDGDESASTIVPTAVSSEHYLEYNLTADTGTFTDSVYVKADGYEEVMLRPVHIGATEGNTQSLRFNIATGTLINAPSGTVGTIQDVGNGWYRVRATFTASGTVTASAFRVHVLNNSGALSFAGDGTSGIQIYGAQREEASTPSSYIPTSGNTATRAAETFTIPSANLPWPEPQYIGDELVTNGDFSSSDDWIQHSTWNISGGVATHSATSGGGLSQAWTPTVGSVYEITFTITGATSGNAYYAFSSASGLVADQIKGVTRTTNGTYKEYLVADATTTYHGVWGTSTFDGSVDNISVREIDPLSVSIAMDGRVSYADTNDANEALLYRWHIDFDNRLQSFLSTAGTRTGQMHFFQEETNVQDSVATGDDYYATGILTPFDIASRHGSTFVNGATEGVALTANTTPTALPDLSSTDMTIAHVYMGTICTFRVWDRDIADTGLVEATNPSLEPSLSLTFEGVGTNSFVVNDWSE